MDAQLRVGLAGFGMSGRIFHAPFIHADPRFSLKKVYERTTERSREEYPYVEVVRRFEDLLEEDIDLVVVNTPNPLHVPMAAQAIRAGKHVVVEKPLAASSQEAAELLKLAQERGVVFTVYQNRRLDGDYLTVKKLIQAGRLGEIVDYECHFDRFRQGLSAKQWKNQGGRGVDIVYDLGIHLIDQAYALFGLPEEVYGDMRKQRPESGGVDKFEFHLYYPDKRVTLSAGELVAKPGPQFMVNGRKGSFVKYGRDVQEHALLAGARPSGPEWGRDDPAHYGVLCAAGEDGMTEETIPTEIGSYGGFYDNLYRAIRQGEPLLVRPEDAVEVLRILEAARRSAEEKRRIAL